MKTRLFSKVFIVACLVLALGQLPAMSASTGGGGGGTGDTSKPSVGGDCGAGYIKLSVALDNGDDCIAEDAKKLKNNAIFVYLRSIIRFLSAGVGVVSLLMIVVSGIQYITSSGNPDAIQGAKKRLLNAILALVLFMFMATILNFLIPGGLL